jgi:alkylation response protein AidB-like acyl-CoA dehydrogenase
MGKSAVSGDVDHGLVQRATALQPLLAEHAARTESGREVVPEAIDALEEAGLFEVIVPERLGGLGATLATQLAVAAELARACASTAWIQTLINVTTWAASLSPAAEELFAPGGPRPRVCGVLQPSGTATPVPGGYLVRGRWAFASGSFCASWFTGGVTVLDADGAVTGLGMATVPRSDFAIDDTWFVAGMCGTASNTVVVEDAFVPANRLSSLSEVSREVGDPSDRWPLGTTLSLILTGPLLGAAQACADIVTAKAPQRAISYTSYATTTESMAAVAAVARARLDVDTAWLHASEAAGYVDAVGRGEPRRPAAEARVRGQIGYLTAMLRRAVDTLLDVGGAGSFASVNVVQRHWRDVNVGSRHAFLATNVGLETYARSLFDLPPVVVIV